MAERADKTEIEIAKLLNLKLSSEEVVNVLNDYFTRAKDSDSEEDGEESNDEHSIERSEVSFRGPSGSPNHRKR